MVHRWIVDSTIRVHSNSLKPVLTEENKVDQLIMVLDSRDPQDPTKFLDMMDHIHVDEKWFFLSQQKERYLLLLEEKNPKRYAKSKSHITKVMFLCAIALILTLLRIHGGMENSGFGQMVIGNQQREHLKTDLEGH